MKVRLMSVTPDALNLIYAAGRQCYSEDCAADIYEQNIDKNDAAKLVTYLRNSGHTSVLEHVKFTFAIDGVSRALTHQLIRHRLASYSQQSQRYVELTCTFDIDNFVVPPKIADNVNAFSEYRVLLRNIQDTYNELIHLGIDPEDARYVLPNAAVTKIVVTMNCVALLHFFGLRCCSLAQWEIRDLADEMLCLCRKELPAVFENAGARCHSLGYCPESKRRSCGIFPVKAEALR